MAKLVLSALALLVAQGFSSSIKHDEHQRVISDPVFLQRQVDLLGLYYHINEPVVDPEYKTIAETWGLEKNIESFKNVTAVKIYVELMEYNMHLPRSVPFNIFEPSHKFEAVTLYNVLISAKDYNSFYKTAVYLRAHVNEGLFVYVLSVAILNHKETKGVLIPPIYEVFPSYLFNGMIMHLAHKVNSYGKHLVEHDPHMYMWDDNVVIRWNSTVWPYGKNVDQQLSYLTHDAEVNMNYYNIHLTYPFWLSEKDISLPQHRRGKFFWFTHKQLVNIYYLERLSNGFGEIPELGLEEVHEGYEGGLVHTNGVSFPGRPNHFHLHEPEFIKHIEKIVDVEHRIRNAIDVGYVISESGDKVSLRTPEAIHVLGNVIEGNVDSPNLGYYGSLVTLWKELLGNSIMHHYHYHSGHVPLVVPSYLEMYQTAPRDPAFYMMWKRILNLFSMLQYHLPSYSHEELSLPSVEIQKVDVDKLVTYVENTYVNITNALYMNEVERKSGLDHFSVMVQYPKLNHKVFQTRIHVKSNAAKKVHVKFFIAPKYDSSGIEIPLHENFENIVQIDEFVHELPAGESEIKRTSTENQFLIDKWTSGFDMYNKAFNALHNKGQWAVDTSELGRFTYRVALPKGRVGGMPIQFIVYISEYHEVHPQEASSYVGIGHDPTSRPFLANLNLGYPFDRPVFHWQTEKLTNLFIQEIQVHHKLTPEIHVPIAMN